MWFCPPNYWQLREYKRQLVSFGVSFCGVSVFHGVGGENKYHNGCFSLDLSLLPFSKNVMPLPVILTALHTLSSNI